MEKEVFNIYKPLGYTPLEAIEKFRELNPAYKNAKMSYAGRLDPLAEGVLIVVSGSKLKEQENYMKMDKEYVAKILLGFSTDTYDLLGISESYTIPDLKEKKLKKIVQKYKGKLKFPFPPYSSYRIQGKPLFWWARNNKLDEITIPQTNTRVYSSSLDSIEYITKENLYNLIKERVGSVKGDFRQKEILEKWDENLKNSKNTEYPILTITINCSSGTYIRTIANDIGKRLNTGGVLMHLLRTRVASYTKEDSIKLLN